MANTGAKLDDFISIGQRRNAGAGMQCILTSDTLDRLNQ